jgi:sugar/nucleoside kinase (ribokinase family)
MNARAMGKGILVVGEINVDLVLSGARAAVTPGKETLVDDFNMALGSASAIAAAGLARLGERVAFLGKVGIDPWGDFCLRELGRAGVDTSRCHRDPACKTGVTVSISSPRDRALVTYLGAIAALTGADCDGVDLEAFDHLHVSSYFLQAGLRPGCRALLARARAAGLSTSLDPGFDPEERWGADLRETLCEVDVFFPNEVELAALTGVADPGEALRRLDNGHTRTVAKLGSAGCMILERGSILAVPAFNVQPVDTTGAGDSFNAGFLHAWLEGRPIGACLRYASACGALSTLRPGGTGGQPDAREVELFLRSRS